MALPTLFGLAQNSSGPLCEQLLSRSRAPSAASPTTGTPTVQCSVEMFHEMKSSRFFLLLRLIVSILTTQCIFVYVYLLKSILLVFLQ